MLAKDNGWLIDLPFLSCVDQALYDSSKPFPKLVKISFVVHYEPQATLHNHSIQIRIHDVKDVLQFMGVCS